MTNDPPLSQTVNQPEFLAAINHRAVALMLQGSPGPQALAQQLDTLLEDKLGLRQQFLTWLENTSDLEQLSNWQALALTVIRAHAHMLGEFLHLWSAIGSVQALKLNREQGVALMQQSLRVDLEGTLLKLMLHWVSSLSECQLLQRNTVPAYRALPRQLELTKKKQAQYTVEQIQQHLRKLDNVPQRQRLPSLLTHFLQQELGLLMAGIGGSPWEPLQAHLHDYETRHMLLTVAAALLRALGLLLEDRLPMVFGRELSPLSAWRDPVIRAGRIQTELIDKLLAEVVSWLEQTVQETNPPTKPTRDPA